MKEVCKPDKPLSEITDRKVRHMAKIDLRKGVQRFINEINKLGSADNVKMPEYLLKFNERDVHRELLKLKASIKK